MKSVLISIQPKWVEKIANGEKTIEVRKTRPKLETPFKCYIYCTKIKNGSLKTRKGIEELGNPYYRIDGKVIGEFVCDRIIDIPFKKPFIYYGKKMFHSNNCCKEACLSYIELEDYLGNKDGFGWHISDLKIYDKPKELSEFRKYSEWLDIPITRPPQSYCYIEDLGE